jgi:hypothetical protein
VDVLSYRVPGRDDGNHPPYDFDKGGIAGTILIGVLIAKVWELVLPVLKTHWH